MGYEKQKNGKLNTQIERYFVMKIRASLKMQKIVKQRSPSRQLLETVNLAFMKIFDSLVKIAVFRASLLFWEICIMLYSRNRTCDPGRNA